MTARDHPAGSGQLTSATRRVKNADPPSRRWLRDDIGGVLVLRGTNVSGSAKWAADRLPPFDWADFVRLRDELGMNCVRLLCFWEAVEPGPGAYDETYLERLRGVAEAASEAGLLVMVDMHQDLWGRGFGSAGAPTWACHPRNYDGFRRRGGPGWFAGYFSAQVVKCFDEFWSDVELQDAFAAAWVRVARTLEGVPGLFALDLFNEPFWGSHSLTRFETRVLPDLYARVTEALRRAGYGGWLALEPASIVNIGYASMLRPPSRERVLLAPHFYPAAVETGVGYAGGRAALDAQLERLEALGRRTELPLVLGEVGVRRNVPGAERYLRDLYDLADERMLGCFQWDLGLGGDTSYGLYDSQGAHTLQSRAVARPVPRRVAGTPLGWRWNAGEGRFELRWIEDGTAKGVTEVAVPQLAFPHGYAAELTGGGEVDHGQCSVRVTQTGGERELVITAA